MNRPWRTIPANSQRDLWKRKVEQIAEETDSLKESLDKHTSRNQKRIMEAKEREGESAHVLVCFSDYSSSFISHIFRFSFFKKIMVKGPGLYSDIGKKARDRLTTITVDEPAPGLKSNFSFIFPYQKSGKVELQYQHEYAGISTSIGLTTSSIVNFSGVIGNNMIAVGIGKLSQRSPEQRQSQRTYVQKQFVKMPQRDFELLPCSSFCCLA
ncbi:Porin domain superfamily [Sesbania bispinosa]|nr:Porin domain superfamily [Sesbania bispinosa]